MDLTKDKPAPKDEKSEHPAYRWAANEFRHSKPQPEHYPPEFHQTKDSFAIEKDDAGKEVQVKFWEYVTDNHGTPVKKD